MSRKKVADIKKRITTFSASAQNALANQRLTQENPPQLSKMGLKNTCKIHE